MSADSSKRQSKQGISGQIVLPQPVNDPSIIDSVAGFIHEVVPQAYQSVISAASGSEVSKESIVWARFHCTDYNDPDNFLADTECQSDSVPPLLIILGYGSGVQVWGISGGGEGRELLSYPQGNVRCLQILCSPQVPPSKDALASKRPIIAIVDNTGPGPQFQTLNFISLRTAEVVKSIKFKTAICDVHCNRKSIVVTFPERIAIFDVLTLEDRMTVTTCYPSPGINPNPIALGHRWLAYCDKKLTTWQRSSGGCEDEGAQSYTATVIHAAKSLGKGLRDLSGSLTGTAQQPQSNTSQPGIVTVIDIETPRITKHQASEDDQTSTSNMVAHFVGHTGPIVAMAFDPSGLLLVVADKHGHRFNVFRLHPHPSSPALAAVHHLYILHRGDTTARVQDVTVSWDSRWVAVSSLRGTTHVFPITPYGGPVAVRTHTTPHVVNRLSRFERSAGLTDGRGSPEGAASVLGGSPRLPPYPHPVVLAPLAQIRRTPTGGETTDSTPAPTVLRLAARFAPPRALLPPRATPPRTPRHQPKPRVADSLFVISSYGSLVQYDIEPRSPANVPKDKISYDTGIEVCVEAKGEWVLLRPPYLSSVQPPLQQGNPLLPAAPAITTHSGRLVETHSPQLHHPAKGQDDRWLSQVEIITHTGPHRRLWMGPQFSFKSLDQSNTEGEQPEPENVPPRSNPVNMPRRPYLWIESSSGGSVEAPYMTDNSEDDSIHGETRLREDLAEAMLDTALNASGGVVEGGEDRPACGVEGVDRAVERRITQFGLVVPVCPVVLPDIRVPIPPEELASRISATAVAAVQEITSVVSEAVPKKEVSVSDPSTSISSPFTPSKIEDVPLEPAMTTDPPPEESSLTRSAPPPKSASTHVDAQTDTSSLVLLPPVMTDKSLNTSIIFEPAIRLPLTSSSSETSSKSSEQNESSPNGTEKSSTNSSSENGSGQEVIFKRVGEKTGKKSRKKKKDDRDMSKKSGESLRAVPSPSEVGSQDPSQNSQSATVSTKVVSESDVNKSNKSLSTDLSDVIPEEAFVEKTQTHVEKEESFTISIGPIQEEADLIAFTPSDEIVPLLSDEVKISTDVLLPVVVGAQTTDQSLDETKEQPISIELVKTECVTTSEQSKVIDSGELSKETKSTLSSSMSSSITSKKESGRGRKKKKQSDSAASKDKSKTTSENTSSVSETQKEQIEEKTNVIEKLEVEVTPQPLLIQLEENTDQLPILEQEEVQQSQNTSDRDFSDPSSGLLIKKESSSEDDKILSKDLEESKIVESTESTESSGKEFKTVSRKKGKSKKHKAKPTVSDNNSSAASSNVVSDVDFEGKVEPSSVAEGAKDENNQFDCSQIVDNAAHKSVESEPEKPGDTIEIEGESELKVEDELEETGADSVINVVPDIEVQSVLEETPISSSGHATARDETSDNVNRSDSEFFVPFVEKRKKKRKNAKEKESVLKVDSKETVTESDMHSSFHKDEGSLDVRRIRRESRSKAKSPSPSPKGDIAADSESSDEAVVTEVKLQTPKQPKRKKPSKRSDTSETREEIPETKSKFEGASDIDYETCSEKKSDSSVESFFDRIKTIDPFSKSWSGTTGEDKLTITEDKDSVYESCNDDEFSSNPVQTTTVVSVEPLPDPVPLESSSSMTEDKTDSGDKDNAGSSQTSTKKHKKQKKKKR